MPVQANLAVPEHSHPGESQSNGKAGRSARTFVELFATLKASLEARLSMTQPLPCAHPIVRWLVEHTAFILHICQIDKRGANPLWQPSWQGRPASHVRIWGIHFMVRPKEIESETRSQVEVRMFSGAIHKHGRKFHWATRRDSGHRSRHCSGCSPKSLEPGKGQQPLWHSSGSSCIV